MTKGLRHRCGRGAPDVLAHASPFVATLGDAMKAPLAKVALTAERPQVTFLWDVKKGKEVGRLKGLPVSGIRLLSGRTNVVFSPDGRQIAVPAGPEAIIVWDVAAGPDSPGVKYPAGNTSSLAFSTGDQGSGR